ncbi:uncharacterized protein LOC123504331 [Portunus trituberculatus]|uniref:uncharacterized protein LOC123504331 n=1 Tax=Portunus trituberculatus TaxID=210409 RepID=UPI001E1CC680|nr:uncharacterized protein LOC123504331 [Portunus trituberculatus]
MLLLLLLVMLPTLKGQSSQGGMETVLVLQASGAPSPESYARLNISFPRLESFTICYRIKLNRFREESTLLSYALSDDRDNELRIDHRETGYKITLQGHWANSNLITPLRLWAHFCFSYHLSSSAWAIYLDGKQRGRGTFADPTQPLEGNGVFIIGQEQDSLGGGFQRDQSFSGELTHLNVWGSVLNEAAVNQIWSCKDVTHGDALAWTSVQESWLTEGEASWSMQSREEVCSTKTRVITVFPDRFSLRQAHHLCHVVGGNILVPIDGKENSMLFETTKDKADKCSGGLGASYLWLGATDKHEEGEWVFMSTLQPLSWQGPWRGDGPNGGTQENCMVMLYGAFPGRWSDIACLDSYSFCVPCVSPHPVTIYLKGAVVCPYSPFNLHYYLGPYRDGKPTLQGFYHSDIYYQNGTWYLQSLKSEAIAWWQPAKDGQYPFGTHVWTLGTEVCDISPSESVNLTISVCGHGDFTCSDGSCIDLRKRCDLRIDCLDQSDEAECSLVAVPPGYRSIIPPSHIVHSEPLPIEFLLKIISFPTIATQEQIFKATLHLSLRWRDNRLDYHNLKEDRTLNLLSHDAVARIWKPRVFFTNAQGNMFTNLDQGSRVECVRGGDSYPGPATLHEEVNVFRGNETSLEMSQLYSATYSCDFYLAMFPFDTQICNLNFTLVSAAASYMVLKPTLAEYVGPKFLIEYEIGEATVEVSEGHEFSNLDVSVKFSRRYTFYLLTLYIPTILLILIAYATFFFNPNDFNSRVVVAVTSLLVLTSLLTQTSNSLPKTSYFKLIDVWLFFSIVIIFLVILLQTLVDFSREKPFSTSTPSTWFRSLMKRLCLRTEKRGPQALTYVRSFSIANKRQEGKNDTTREYMSDDRRARMRTFKEEWEKDRKDKLMHMMDDKDRGGHFYSGGRKNTEEEVNMSLMVKSRVLIPILYLIFNAVYWTVSLREIFSR